jgi:Uma2 family endonuclease
LFSRSDDGIVVRMAAPPVMTIDEYFRTPETVLPAELKFGALYVREAPSARHQSAVGTLFLTLTAYVSARDIGKVWLSPLDVILDEERALVVQPDLMFISSEREWIVRDRVHGAPDLVVEVLSPNPRIGNTEERLTWFATYGVRECWVVHLDRREVTVFNFANRRMASRRVCNRRESIVSQVFTDFTETFDDIFAP